LKPDCAARLDRDRRENVVARLSGWEGRSGIRESVLGEPIAPLWEPERMVEVAFHPPAPIPVNVEPVAI
jgi:hypothetical protein